MYVYLISNYDDYGSENMAGCVSRKEMHRLVDGYEHVRDEDRKDIIAAIEKLFHDLPDDELADGNFKNLQEGWGGIQLHVVKVV